MKESVIKNITIILTEFAVIFLMIFNVLPREASWFLTGLMIFYFIFSPLEDSLWVFIASIPLFIALPIREGFDTLANWRILSIVLFLVLFFKQGISVRLAKDKSGLWKLKENFKHYRVEYLEGILVLIMFLSLLVADNFWIGLKKIIFLVNAFLIYIIIRNIAAKNKGVLDKVISALKTAIGITLGIGFVQLIMAFFMNLHQFWYLWDRHIINVYYGQNLSNLLSYSNTWFSYYSFQLPTLRMFSVFPDSHSFAFFSILSLTFFLGLIFLRPAKKSYSAIKNHAFKTIIYYLLLIICLLAIIFSGSRGAWAGAIISFLTIIFIVFLRYSPTIRSYTNFFTTRFYKSWRKQIYLILGSLILFFVLFPIASTILFLPQYIQLGQETVMGVSFFERARSIIDFTEISVKSRLEIWRRTVDSIILHPWLGVGIGNFPIILNEELAAAKKGSSAHSLYLDFAAEIGVFGLLILLAICWYIFRDAWKIFTKSRNSFFRVWAGFFIFALIWILGYSLFDVVLLNDKVLLFFVSNIGILYGAKLSLSFNKSS